MTAMEEYIDRHSEVQKNAYDHITNLGVLKPALIDVSHNLELCRTQGHIFGAEATKRGDNPYPKGTAAREWFDAGWLDEQDELCGEP